jgi:hypothetical protein
MEVKEICEALQVEQRNRAAFLKSRIMLENRLTANVAGWLGYKPSDDEAERGKQWDAARSLIKQLEAGEHDAHPLLGLVLSSKHGSDGFGAMVKAIEKNTVKLAKQLPVAEWAQEVEQRGFGLQSLAVVVGECGDLSNYAGPAKVWKRMGCAPFESRGKTFMGATWRAGKQGSLSAEEWSQFGYSPRRRSIAFVIGENLIKQNQEGPYRKRYDTVKADVLANRPDWTTCGACKGSGKSKSGKAACGNCKGTGSVALRCHRHAMLLATKLLLKNLWIEWNRDGAKSGANEGGVAVAVL